MQHTVTIDHTSLETFGDLSLEGLIGVHVSSGDVVVVEFVQTSLAWRELNNGPKTVLCPEFAVPCLLKSVLSLVDKNVSVRVSVVRSGRDANAGV